MINKQALKDYGLTDILFKDWGTKAELLNKPGVNQAYAKWINQPKVIPWLVGAGRQALNVARMMHLGNPKQYIQNIQKKLPANAGALDVLKTVGKHSLTSTLNPLENPIGMGMALYGINNSLQAANPQEGLTGVAKNIAGDVLTAPLMEFGAPGMYAANKLKELSYPTSGDTKQ